ncbi:hypothetical protein Y032_0028g1755 [Ancylostoma ceylanicum]|uniref:Peptidase M28 domain-containing protein n=1 Tax=Ancylostoma ceylanicum TaxID=53326 RepID=A0A016USR8_9BILA|nr:hypothetical protein Y032_0028g1755 [Ancylostoma ceylanicum]
MILLHVSCLKVYTVAVCLSKNGGNQNRAAVLLNCHYDSWPTSSGWLPNLVLLGSVFMNPEALNFIAFRACRTPCHSFYHED